MKASGGVVFLVVLVTSVLGARPCPKNCQVIRNPSLPTCNKDTGTCSRGCATRYYGNTCNMTCDDNCREETCQQQDGFCICRTGYTSHNGSCDVNTVGIHPTSKVQESRPFVLALATARQFSTRPIPALYHVIEEFAACVKCESNDHCLNNNCVSASRRDCSEGCKPGWFGKFCDHSCASHCVCDEVNGNCTSCIPGWYGAECESICSLGCVDKKCDRLSGFCTSCIPGWYGSLCGSLCSPGCLNKNCHRNGSCDKKCISGSYGVACDQKCSEHCSSGCDQLSGECVQCEAGRYGSTCQSECSAGCAGAENDCDRDGRCSSGCKKGFYGEKCHSCPQQCFGDLCDEHGTCSACNNGFFGTSCHELCLRCKDGVCHQKTGTCSIGCQSGFYGSLCNLTCEDCTGGDCYRATGECRFKGELSSVQSWVGGGVAVVILIIIAVYMSRRLKRIEKRREGPASTVPDVRLVASQGHFELEEQVTLTPPRLCLTVPMRQTSYIQPRHSGNFGHFQTQHQVDEPQRAAAPPSDRLLQEVLRRSDELSERPDSYALPHYCEVNEERMTTPPQPTQGAQTPTSVVKTNIFSVAADVHGTRGDISIPPIAECFRPTGTEDSSHDLQPLVENYDHLNREVITRIGGDSVFSNSHADDEVRTSPARLCLISTEKPDDYIEPRHSGCIVPYQQQMLCSIASDQQEDKPQAAVAPPSDETLIVPQPAQGAEAPVNAANNSSLSVIADVHTNGGDITIPLIAECFGPTETEDSSPDEGSKLLVENYDHLLKDHYMKH